MPVNCGWQVLDAEFQKPYMHQLQLFLQDEWACQVIYPPKESIFRAFNSVPFDQVWTACCEGSSV